MTRLTRMTSKRPIVSNKEVVDSVVFIVAAGVITDITIAATINNYAGAVGTMPLGSSIKGFYIESSYNNVDNIIGRTDWYLCKVPGGVGAAAFPTPGATGGSNFRNKIYHERKGIGQGAPTTAGGQVAKSVEFVRVPKGKQRMAEGEEWVLRIGSSENYSFCLKVIYKWYA